MIKAIFISKERNGTLEMPPEVNVVAGKGILGDRYFNDHNRKSPDYEITFIESEKVDEYNSEIHPKIEYWQPRRNILTAGVDLKSLIGKKFQIGSGLFEGIEPCEPCEILKMRTSSIAFKWFTGKGGLRAKIIGTGTIKIGDNIKLVPQFNEPKVMNLD
jgi:MOSC domain-containing protein YiiM